MQCHRRPRPFPKRLHAILKHTYSYTHMYPHTHTYSFVYISCRYHIKHNNSHCVDALVLIYWKGYCVPCRACRTLPHQLTGWCDPTETQFNANQTLWIWQWHSRLTAWLGLAWPGLIWLVDWLADWLTWNCLHDTTCEHDSGVFLKILLFWWKCTKLFMNTTNYQD